MRLRLSGWHPMLRLRLCALLALLSLICTAVVSAEMQECDPVSAHPEGKIVCRPFGPSATSSVPSPPVASSDAIQQIGQLIDKYGEPAIIAFIRARRSGHITLSVGTGFRTFYGSPNPSYVTPQTILMDLEALRLSPTQLEATLQEQAARTEQTRQATAQQNLKDEAARQRKTSADIAAQARARERAEAEASEKWEREAKTKMKAEEERRQQAQAQQRSLDNQVRRILEQPPPPDYKERIDAAFERILKDPDSRKIEYHPPHGSAVCGMVNARNSYGGYTGRQVFLSYFDALWKVEELKIYKDDDFL